MIHIQSNLLQNYECPLRCYDELRYIGLSHSVKHVMLTCQRIQKVACVVLQDAILCTVPEMLL